MVRLKLLVAVLVYAMLTLAIIVIITDVLLAISLITATSTSKFWPLEIYKSLLIPGINNVAQVVRLEPTAREAPFKIVEVGGLRSKVPHRSPFALPAEKAANGTFIFHVCPGAGSGVLIELIQKLKATHPAQIAHIEEMPRLSFPPIRDWSHWNRVRNLLINVISNSSKPSIIIVESPVFLTINSPDTHYLSLLYDPLKRLQNHFLLDHWGDNLQNYMHPNWPQKPPPSFEHCVQVQGKDCSYAYARYFYTLWFCGFDRNPNCVKKGKVKEASILSRRTIREFLAVGVMEELQKFLVVLELLVPSVFSGLEGIYLSDEFREVVSQFAPKRNLTLSPEIEHKIRFTLTEDYQIFNFTRTHFLEKFRRVTFNSSLDRR